MLSRYSSRIGAWQVLGGFAAAVICIFFLYGYFKAGFVGDKKWMWFAAESWLDGKILYRDLIEINPPLIFAIYASLLFVGQHIPFLESYQFVLGATHLLTVASLAISVTLLRRHPLFQDRKNIYIAIGGLVFIAFALPNPFVFAEREHWLVLLCLPYCLRFLPQMPPLPPRLRALSALMAMVGFCVKPHAILIWGSIALFYIIRQRSLRHLLLPENLAIYGFGALYAFLVWLFLPEYFTQVLPLLTATYSDYNISAQIYFLGGVLPIVAALFCPSQNDRNYLLALIGGSVAYVLSNNGWAYTYYPFWSAASLLALWIILEQRQASKQTAAWLCVIHFAAMAIFSTLLMAAAIRQTSIHGSPFTDREARVITALNKEIKKIPNMRAFSGYSTGCFWWFDLLRAHSGVSFVSRYPGLWMAPAVFARPDPEKQTIWNKVAGNVAEDLNTHKPELVFMDASPAAMGARGAHIDLLKGLLETDTAFASAWRSYRHIKTINECLPNDATDTLCRVEIYRRRK